MLRHGKYVLVPASAHIDDDDTVFRHRRRDLGKGSDGVTGLKRRDDTFGSAKKLERLERFGVGHGGIVDPPDFLEPCVLGADARIIETCADRIAFDDLPVRSEEHTSELQSLMRISYAVFCLQKKTNRQKSA